MTTSSSHDSDTRAKCLQMLAGGGVSIADVSVRYNVSTRTLYRWRRAARPTVSKRQCASLQERLACVREVQRLGRGRSVGEVCKRRGISTRTFYRWLAQRREIERLLEGEGGAGEGRREMEQRGEGDRRRIVVCNDLGHCATFVWFKNALSRDIKACIARRFGLSELHDVVVRRLDAPHDMVVSSHLESGTYRLV